MITPTECIMGSGGTVTAGPANDARCVCEGEGLGGGRVQVTAQPGGSPPGPVTKAETQPSYTPYLYCWLWKAGVLP